jgi:hypothetical protein
MVCCFVYEIKLFILLSVTSLEVPLRVNVMVTSFYYFCRFSAKHFLKIVHPLGGNFTPSFTPGVNNLYLKTVLWILKSLSTTFLIESSSSLNVTSANKPAVNVMITIFFDFCQFWAKNWSFS